MSSRLILAFQLDERTKKVILVLCALFIILLLICGAIYYFVNKYMQNESKKVDQYMYDLCLYKIVKTPREFRKAVSYYERRNFFNKSKWPWRCLVLLCLIMFGLAYFFLDNDFNSIFTQFFNLFPKMTWQTVGQINEKLDEIGATLLSGPSWLPASPFPTFVSKNPDFNNPALYFSTIFYVVSFICVYSLFLSVIGFIARSRRGKKMSVEVFQKKLDNLSMVDNIANAIASPIPTTNAQQTNGGEQNGLW